MASIQFSGAISGIDTSAILDSIALTMSRPIFLIEDRIALQEREQTALGDIRSRLATLLTQVQRLTDSAALTGRIPTASVSAADKAVAGVQATSAAAVGTFKVSVEQLATVSKLTSAAEIGDPILASATLDSGGFGLKPTVGTFTVNGVELTIDASTVLSDGVDDGASNSILGKINNSGTGATASLVLDGSGRTNALNINSDTPAVDVSLGSLSDTSNFLTAAHLLASPVSDSRTSTRGLGQTLATTNLVDSRLATPVAAGTGSFTINGVTIDYDADNESLQNVLDAINESTAGVTANYNSTTDKIILTSDTTGAIGLTVSDDVGNLMAALDLTAGTEVLGQNAEFKIDGGASQYSTTNTVKEVMPGVTLLLLEANPGDQATITIKNDDGAIVSAVKDFVEQYNSTMTLINDSLAIDLEGTNGLLSGDATVRSMSSSLRSVVTGIGTGLTGAFTNLGDIGVSFGAPGAALGATEIMLLDEAELRDQITADRSSVVELLSGLEASGLFAAGDGSLASATGNPDNARPGVYTITDDGAGNLTITFDPTDGGSNIVTNGTIAAGASSSTLIPGMTLTALGSLQAGSDTITVTRSKEGIGVLLENQLDRHLRSKGTLDGRDEAISATIKDMNERIEKIEARIESEQIRLARKFAAMEAAFARFESQKSVLDSLSSALSFRRK